MPHSDFVPIPLGTVFNKWTVLEHAKGRGYLCECVCGTRKIIVAKHLRNGYRKACTKCTKCRPVEERMFNRVFGSYKLNALKMHRIFELSRGFAKSLLLSPCHYCGQTLSNFIRGFSYNGIDRLDNGKGYLEENCVSCCRVCNHMKHVLTQEEFLAHVKRICEHRSL
jgi:hypothetical protein